MATQEQKSSSLFDTALLWLSIAVLCASIFGYYWFEPQYNDLIRVLGMLAGGAVAIVIALQTSTGKTAWAYIQGSRTELRRVVWPNRQETVQTTLMVIVVVMILAMFIWALDVVLAWGVQILTGR
jgi:preprotein translocase subunit SecE